VCLEGDWSGLRENVVQLTKSGVHLAMKNGVCFEKEGSVFGESGVLGESGVHLEKESGVHREKSGVHLENEESVMWESAVFG